MLILCPKTSRGYTNKFVEHLVFLILRAVKVRKLFENIKLIKYLRLYFQVVLYAHAVSTSILTLIYIRESV